MARHAQLLPVPYFHVVFTLPSAAVEIAFQNKQTVYALLMRAAAQALVTLAAKRLPARIGLIVMLHTWGQTLTHHPHVHCLVPAGGVFLDGGRWIACKPNFLLSVHALSRTFRRLFLDGLEAVFRREELGFFDDLAMLAEPGMFAERVRALRRSPFVVYAKPPFGGPERVLAYLARYTHRTAIANSRLVAVDDEEVAFSNRDYCRGGRFRVMRLSRQEFMRRFLLHVLPDGFHRIRHCGFFAKGERRRNLALVLALLEPQTGQDPGDTAPTPADGEPKADAPHDPFAVCSECGGLMRPVGRAPRTRGRRLPLRHVMTVNAALDPDRLPVFRCRALPATARRPNGSSGPLSFASTSTTAEAKLHATCRPCRSVPSTVSRPGDTSGQPNADACDERFDVAFCSDRGIGGVEDGAGFENLDSRLSGFSA